VLSLPHFLAVVEAGLVCGPQCASSSMADHMIICLTVHFAVYALVIHWIHAEAVPVWNSIGMHHNWLDEDEVEAEVEVMAFHWPVMHNSFLCHLSGCLTLLEILEIFWKFAKTPGNFLAEFVCLLLLWLTVLVFQNVSVETSGSKPGCHCNC